MNPIQSYFEWHDARCLARAGDPRKNQSDIRLLRLMRVALFLTEALILVLLLAAGVLAALRKGSLAEDSVFVLGVMLAPVTLFYGWVAEALLFRRYINEHGAKS